jgi:uncharacterized membrane protein YwzB
MLLQSPSVDMRERNGQESPATFALQLDSFVCEARHERSAQATTLAIFVAWIGGAVAHSFLKFLTMLSIHR